MKTPKSTKSRVYLWIDFHGHKQPEGSVWVQGVQFLFQSYQPLRRQVDILQQNPSKVKRNQIISVYPLSPNIHIQILQTDLYIFPFSMS